MSDGSGRINLHGPAIDDDYPYDTAFTVSGGDGWYYKYNPCNGFSMGVYYDLAVSVWHFVFRLISSSLCHLLPGLSILRLLWV